MSHTDKLTETFMSLRRRISRLVSGIVPPKEVEDIVQETYVRVCQVENIDAIRKPRSFMFRTARNLALDHVKRAETRLTRSTEEIDEFGIPTPSGSDDLTFGQVASDEEFVLFCDAVRNLPRQCRRAFVLKKVYGYTLKEIAEIMDVAVPTVESHIVNGTRKCVQYLRKQRDSRTRPAQSSRRDAKRMR